MPIQEIIEFVKANAPELPGWFLSIFWHVVAALILVWLLTLLFKAVSNADFRGPVSAIWTFSKTLVKTVLTGSLRVIESPIERPRSKLAFRVLSLVHSYLMCLTFVSLLFGSIFLFVTSASPRTWKVDATFAGASLLFLYIAAFYRAEADRDWLAVKEQWALVRNKGAGAA